MAAAHPSDSQLSAPDPAAQAGPDVLALLEGLPDVVFRTDAEGRWTYLNPAWTTLTGLVPSESLGRAAGEQLGLPAGAVLAEGTTRGRVRTRSGGVRDVEVQARLRRDDRGAPAGLVGTVRDVTERRLAEEALRWSEARFRSVIEHASDIILLVDTAAVIEYASPAVTPVLGYEPDALVGLAVHDFVHAEDWALVLAALLEVIQEHRAPGIEARVRDAAGQWRWVQAAGRLLADGDRRSIVVNLRDLTERRRAEDELRASEERYRLLIERGSEMITVLDAQGTIRYESPSVRQVLGYRPDQLEGTSAFDLMHPDERPALLDTFARLLETPGEAVTVQFRFREADGGWRELEAVARNLLDVPAVAGIVVNSRDATQRLAAERALREREAQFRAIFEEAANGIALVTLSGDVLHSNAALQRFLGYDADELARMNLGAVSFGEDQLTDLALFAEVIEGRRTHYEMEKRYRRKDGSVVWGHLVVSLVRQPDGAARYAVGMVQDITERKRAEEALRASEERFRSVAQVSHSMIFEWDLRTDTVYRSEALASTFGYGPELVTPEENWWVNRIHPEDRPEALAALPSAIAGAGDGWSQEYRFLRADGTYATVLERSQLVRDAAGEPTRLIGMVTDVSDRILLEAQLRQAQKMEAVGQLAGGIAHDFNNLLAAITVNLELLGDALPDDGAGREEAEQIRHATERAAMLTRQLLAFSRRQVTQPRVLDLNATVATVERLLRRLLPPGVTLEAAPEPALWPMRADAGQLEQVVLNLCLNARDAMPEGGVLTVTTWNATLGPAPGLASGSAAGEYVAIAVSDTGVGMDEGTRARIFEPFFTTKEPGKGTGLGLATVYGIVQELAGRIDVRSAPRAGTTVTVYLPRSGDPAFVGGGGAAAAPRRLPRGTETVLLVEDETALRASTRRVLERHGYTVLEARHGADALRLADAYAAEHGAPPALVITDLMMPEMDGRTLLERLRARAPSQRALVISGYDARVAGAATGALPRGVAFLEKPFSVECLLVEVRRVLDAPPAALVP